MVRMNGEEQKEREYIKDKLILVEWYDNQKILQT